MSDFKSQSFKRLNLKWKKKLAESGFTDIEDENGKILDKFDKTAYKMGRDNINFRTDFFDSIRDYYLWASRMLQIGSFKTPRHKKIWELHSNGISSRKISKEVLIDQSLICKEIKKMKQELYYQEILIELAPKKE